MKSVNQQHLQEEQIIWAVIDELELGEKDRLHLSECPDCGAKVNLFKQELQQFGEHARLSVPPLLKAVKLPVEKPAPVSERAGWLPFFGAAAMAGLVVFFYIMGMADFSPSRFVDLHNQGALLEDEIFMQKISEMVENPLYEEMYEITGDNSFDFDDEFLDFIIPEVQEDFQSELNNQGGIKQC